MVESNLTGRFRLRRAGPESVLKPCPNLLDELSYPGGSFILLASEIGWVRKCPVNRGLRSRHDWADCMGMVAQRHRDVELAFPDLVEPLGVGAGDVDSLLGKCAKHKFVGNSRVRAGAENLVPVAMAMA